MLWIMLVALVSNGQILQEAQYPLPFKSEEACVAKIHEIADKYNLTPEVVTVADGGTYYVIPEKNGYVTFADCVPAKPQLDS